MGPHTENSLNHHRDWIGKWSSSKKIWFLLHKGQKAGRLRHFEALADQDHGAGLVIRDVHLRIHEPKRSRFELSQTRHALFGTCIYERNGQGWFGDQLIGVLSAYYR